MNYNLKIIILIICSAPRDVGQYCPNHEDESAGRIVKRYHTGLMSRYSGFDSQCVHYT